MKNKSLLFLTVGLGLTLAAVWLLTLAGFGIPEAHAASFTVCSTGCDYSVIQDAVDAAADGDVIKVAAGTYDDVNNYSDLAQVVYINKSVTIRGGYTTAFTEPPDPVANPTTLDAKGLGRVIYIEGNVSPTIEGLQITGGDANVLEPILGGPVSGGGVQIYDAAATLKNNQIFGNSASAGAGVHLWNSNAILEDNTISANIADGSGGGLFLANSPATLDRNTISENIADDAGQGGGGGGLFLDSSAATLSHNTILSNSAESGGGVFIWASDNIQLFGNRILSNMAASQAGGLDCLTSENVRINGNTFSYNSAPYAGGLDVGCTGLLNGNLISNNTAGQAGGLAACNISIEGNTITANSATSGAGGIFLWECDKTTLKGNTISENTAGWGAGVQMAYGEYTLINNIIVDNQADSLPSGIMVGTSTAHLLHNTIASNTGGDGTGIWVDGDGTITLTNTIIVSQTIGIQIDGIATLESTLWGSGIWANGTDWTGGGTINHNNDYWDDPDFVDYLAGNYHIGENSAAIDAGIDAGVTTDIDFHPRPYLLPDIGADEYWPPGTLTFIYLPLVLK